MGGGKSSSSTNTTTTQETTTSSAAATGTVGDVLQGQYVTIQNELPDSVANVFGQLIKLAGQSIDTAAAAGGKAIDATNAYAEKAAQPDLTLVENYQKQVYYIIGAVAAIATAYFIFRK